MFYSLYTAGNQTPDKIIKRTFKPIRMNRRGKIKVKLPIFKKVDKDNVVGYLSGKVSDRSHKFDADKNILSMYVDDELLFFEVNDEAKSFARKVGYLQVGENEYIGVQKKLLFILWLLFGIGASLGLAFYISTCLVTIPDGNVPANEDIAINKPSANINTINLDDIPVDTGDVDMTQEMVYVSGQSITLVKESYPNVYLKNEAINVNYTLVYEAYLNGSDTPCYTTGHIAAGMAEPWEAYTCDELIEGNNSVLYEVYFYDLDGNMVGQTTLTGLTITKG